MILVVLPTSDFCEIGLQSDWNESFTLVDHDDAGGSDGVSLLRVATDDDDETTLLFSPTCSYGTDDSYTHCHGTSMSLETVRNNWV